MDVTLYPTAKERQPLVSGCHSPLNHTEVKLFTFCYSSAQNHINSDPFEAAACRRWRANTHNDDNMTQQSTRSIEHNVFRWGALEKLFPFCLPYQFLPIQLNLIKSLSTFKTAQRHSRLPRPWTVGPSPSSRS